eukprot:9102596-Lingulodinium_polyedra.AAC.1
MHACSLWQPSAQVRHVACRRPAGADGAPPGRSSHSVQAVLARSPTRTRTCVCTRAAADFA